MIASEYLTGVWKGITRLFGDDGNFEVPAVCLLVAVYDQQNSEDMEQEHVLKWCVDNGFELIEWIPEGNQKGMLVISPLFTGLSLLLLVDFWCR